MHRTQISLEDHQYDGLMQEVRRRRISLSALIRQLAAEYLQQQKVGQEKDPLKKLAGIAEGSGEAVGRNHNQYLYGKRR